MTLSMSLSKLRRSSYLLAAAAMLAASIVPALFYQTAHGAQLDERSIQLSSSAPGATDVDYQVTFTTPTAGANSVVIDFCSNSPFPGDSCTVPAGMSAAGVTLEGLEDWSASGAANSIDITNDEGSALTTAQTQFELRGITNPSEVGSFYARIYTYASANASEHTGATSPGEYLDFGGAALSIADVIGVTARVQETLTFCVSGDEIEEDDCSDALAPTLVLGSGDPAVLSPTNVDTANAYTRVSTNAFGGVALRMKNSNSCGGLSTDGGDNCAIEPVGELAEITAGDALFGVNVSNSSGEDSGSEPVTATANYSGTGYGMVLAGVTSTYGDLIAQSSGPTSNANNQLIFAASASNITPAGQYTADIILIATGTY